MMKKLLTVILLTSSLMTFATDYRAGVNILKTVIQSDLKAKDYNGNALTSYYSDLAKEEISLLLDVNRSSERKLYKLDCQYNSRTKYSDCEVIIMGTQEESSVMLKFSIKGNKIRNNTVQVMLAG
jgi:hypothetical protein